MKRKLEVAILISDKVGFKECKMRQGHYIMIKGSI